MKFLQKKRVVRSVLIICFFSIGWSVLQSMAFGWIVPTLSRATLGLIATAIGKFIDSSLPARMIPVVHQSHIKTISSQAPSNHHHIPAPVVPDMLPAATPCQAVAVHQAGESSAPVIHAPSGHIDLVEQYHVPVLADHISISCKPDTMQAQMRKDMAGQQTRIDNMLALISGAYTSEIQACEQQLLKLSRNDAQGIEARLGFASMKFPDLPLVKEKLEGFRIQIKHYLYHVDGSVKRTLSPDDQYQIANVCTKFMHQSINIKWGARFFQRACDQGAPGYQEVKNSWGVLQACKHSVKTINPFHTLNYQRVAKNHFNHCAQEVIFLCHEGHFQ